MFDIEFKINGRKIRPNQIADALERAMFEQVQKGISQKLKGILDPITGERPKVIVKGRSLDDLTFEVQGSDELIQEVQRKLK